MHKQRIAILVLAAIGMLATFLPWVEVPIFGTVTGTKGDGWITLGLFAVTLILSVLGNRSAALGTGLLIGAIVPALAAAGIGIWKIVDLKGAMNDMGPFSNAVSIGIGLYLLILAGLLVPVLGFVLKGKKATA